MASSLQKMYVSDLRVGMYVAKLDRDWLETPFILQGFMLESQEDVDIVAEYCSYVYVDTVFKALNSTATGTARAKGPIQYQNTTRIDEEHRKIVGAFARRAPSPNRCLMTYA